MSHSVGRIGLIGGECTGKSVLAAELGRQLPACVVPEELRAFVNRNGRAPLRDEQRDVMSAQMSAEETIAATCTQPWLVGDPTPLMTAIYSLAYFDDDSLLDEAVAHAAGYDRLLWCDVDVPWQPDGEQRDGPEFRDRVHELIGRVVRERLEPRGMTVTLVSGAVDVRVAAAQRAWQPRPPTAST